MAFVGRQPSTITNITQTTEMTEAARDTVITTHANNIGIAIINETLDTAEASRYGWDGSWVQNSKTYGLYQWAPEMVAVLQNNSPNWSVVIRNASNGIIIASQNVSSEAPTAIAAAHGYLSVASNTGVRTYSLHKGNLDLVTHYHAASSPMLSSNVVLDIAMGLPDYMVKSPHYPGPKPATAILYGASANAYSWVDPYDNIFTKARTTGTGNTGITIFNGSFAAPETNPASTAELLQFGPFSDLRSADFGGSYTSIKANAITAFSYGLGSVGKSIASSPSHLAVGGSGGLSVAMLQPGFRKGMFSYGAGISNTYNTGYTFPGFRAIWLANSNTADRTDTAQTLTMNGAVTATAVASGAELQSYTGWSATNYLSRATHPELKFGATEGASFYFSTWLYFDTTDFGTIYSSGALAGTGFRVEVNSTAKRIRTNDGSTFTNSTIDMTISAWNKVDIFVQLGTVYFYINGKAAGTSSVGGYTSDPASPTARIGVTESVGNALTSSYRLALLKIGALLPTAETGGRPSDEDILRAYNAELPMFQTNAKCLLQGSTAQVDAIAVDYVTNRIYVGQSNKLQYLDGLAITTVNEAALNAGSGISSNIDKITAFNNNYYVLTGTGQVYQKAPLLNYEEILQKISSMKEGEGSLSGYFDSSRPWAQFALAATATNVTGSAADHNFVWGTRNAGNLNTETVGSKIYMPEQGIYLVIWYSSMSGILSGHNLGQHSIILGGTLMARHQFNPYAMMDTTFAQYDSVISAVGYIGRGGHIQTRAAVGISSAVIDYNSGSVNKLLIVKVA